ncbi:MAG TPA: alpha/beta fold hydrolase [Thermoanaerobaculia bacterium]|nr:alpha/beta fold hydrolase [Thermoanaerobaculia bacterium]
MITFFNGFLGVDRDWDFVRDIETPERVLVGYSMGGRLALQVLIEGAVFDRAVIVSAGLNLEEGRDERRARDEAWARRFESDPWYEVLRDWNAQPVFGGHVVERFERDYDRRELARRLRESSPGVLAQLAPRLHEIKIPVLWIAGERDKTYVEVGKRAVGLLPNAELWICPNAGHRVPWEQPQAFAARLREFVGAR